MPNAIKKQFEGIDDLTVEHSYIDGNGHRKQERLVFWFRFKKNKNKQVISSAHMDQVNLNGMSSLLEGHLFSSQKKFLFQFDLPASMHTKLKVPSFFVKILHRDSCSFTGRTVGFGHTSRGQYIKEPPSSNGRFIAWQSDVTQVSCST